MRETAAGSRFGFTLFEVAIALALVAIGVVSVALLLPAGIKAQQLARFRLYAAAKAVDLVESYCTSSNGNPSLDIEAPNPWDVPTNDRSTAADLECRLASRRFGIAPLPLDIARRLDSDGDQIARLLDEGACVYYSQPQATTSWQESSLPTLPPNDMQKLVFAVVGEAQQDALFVFPWKAWPYTTAYPSPPIFEHHWDAFLDPSGDATPDCGATFGCYTRDFRCYLWEETSDPDIRNVLQHPYPPSATLAENYGYFPYAYPRDPYALPAPGAPEGPLPTGLSAEGAVRYVQAALWYCAAKGLDASFWDIRAPLADFVGGPADDQRWKQVDAMRFLAHAGACLTRWYTKAQLDAGVDVASVTWNALAPPMAAVSSPALKVTHDHLLAWHESSLALEWRYAAADPYDWGAPRSVQRAMMMDWPLLQHDLFSPPLSGPIAGAPTLTGSQWKAVAPRPITNLGVGCSYPKMPIDQARIWGERSHFNLCAPFAPSERCRELVFWVVDWQAYEDFETCASAPVDASRYPKAGPLTTTDPRVGGNAPQRDFASLMWGFPFIDCHIYSYRNAESVFSFTSDMSGVPTGADVSASRVLNATPDQGTSDAQRRIFNGLWGGDRNFNGRLDRGPVPKSARMRAVEVARYPYYDLRVPFMLR